MYVTLWYTAPMQVQGSVRECSACVGSDMWRRPSTAGFSGRRVSTAGVGLRAAVSFTKDKRHAFASCRRSAAVLETSAMLLRASRYNPPPLHDSLLWTRENRFGAFYLFTTPETSGTLEIARFKRGVPCKVTLLDGTTYESLSLLLRDKGIAPNQAPSRVYVCPPGDQFKATNATHHAAPCRG